MSLWRSTPKEQSEAEKQLSAIILARFASIVEDVTGLEPEESTQLDKNFVDDLGIDSLAMVEIVVQAEDLFGVRIPDEDISSLTTVEHVRRYVLDFIRWNPEAAVNVAQKFNLEAVTLVRDYAEQFKT